MESLETKLSLRIRIDNLPSFFSILQVRKFLSKYIILLIKLFSYACIYRTFPGTEYKRLKTMRQVAILTFTKEEDALNALDILNKTQIKKFTLSAKRVAEELVANVYQLKNVKKGSQHATASELVTPLAGLPYSEQLEKKFAESKAIVNNLIRHIAKTGVNSAFGWRNCLKEVNKFY